MKTRPYFDKQIKERGIKVEWVKEALRNEVEREVQPDGRIRVWGWVEDLGKYIRIILLEDGETLLNAFPDRNFTKQRLRP